MKKLSIITLIWLFALCAWHSQSSRLHSLRQQNEKLSTVAEELSAEIQQLEAKTRSTAQRIDEVSNSSETAEAYIPSTNAELAPKPISMTPDPSRHGGWSQSDSFFYLHKQELTNASYRLLQGGALTDEAAALLGLSRNERDEIDRAFSDLLGQFRHLEIEKMQLVPAPTGWVSTPQAGASSAAQFESALTYYIPDLSSDIDAARKTFCAQLTQTVGTYRSDLIEKAARDYLRDRMDDLGTGERTIGFVWQREQDGSSSLWYGTADVRHGAGSFERVPQDIDSHSQIAYYAGLFGVKLPSKN